MLGSCCAIVGCGGRSVYTGPPDGCFVQSDEFLLLRADGELFGVSMPDFELRPIGRPHCGEITYDALAVARTGEAYVADTDGHLYRVTPDLRCEGPVFDPPDFGEFMGMTFVGDGSGKEIIQFTQADSEVVRLGTIDPTSGQRQLGPVVFARTALELAGGEDGRLFGINGGNSEVERSLIELDPRTGAIQSERPFGRGLGLCSLALLRWADALYGFAAPYGAPTSHVYRFDLELQHVSVLPLAPFDVIGAGASSCAADRQAGAAGASGR